MLPVQTKSVSWFVIVTNVSESFFNHNRFEREILFGWIFEKYIVNLLFYDAFKFLDECPSFGIMNLWKANSITNKDWVTLGETAFQKLFFPWNLGSGVVVYMGDSVLLQVRACGSDRVRLCSHPRPPYTPSASRVLTAHETSPSWIDIQIGYNSKIHSRLWKPRGKTPGENVFFLIGKWC